MNTFAQRLCLLLLLVCGLKSYSQETLSYNGADTDALLKQASAEKKPVFIMVYATWCSHCNKMKKEVFTNPDVSKFLKQNYITGGIDGETEKGKQLKKQYNITSYPAFIMLDASGTVLYKLAGEFTAQELITETQNALVIEKQLPYLEQQFNADPGNPAKCLAYITTLLKGKNRKELSIPTHKYLATQNEAQLLTETNWRIISNGVSDIDSKEFKYVLNNRAKFEKLISPARVNRKIENIATEYLNQFFEDPDIAVYSKKREVVKNIDLPNTNDLLLKYDLQIAEAAQDWKFYKKITDEAAGAITDQSLLKEIAANYLEHYNDAAALEMAAKWLEQSLAVNDAYAGEILVAKLYRKSGNEAKSIKAANKAKQIAVEMDWDANEANEILASYK